MNKCKDCEHFLGGGDFGTCCTKTYWLKYAETLACELFKPKEICINE